MKRNFFTACLMLFFFPALANTNALFPEDTLKPVKIKHADPVYEDLTTDLGARKGENQLNINFGYRDLTENHHIFLSKVEYEFAPLDGLGLEIIVPYTVYFNNQLSEIERPGNRMEFFQRATQYTFFTSPEHNISLALSFRNTFETRITCSQA